MNKDRNFNKEFINGLNNYKGQTLTKNSKPTIYDKKSGRDKHSGSTHCSYISTIHASKRFKFKKKKHELSELELKKIRLSNRIRSKYVNHEIIFPLLNLNSPLKKQYWDTWHCSKTIKQNGHELNARYCKHRWCLICNRIKTADCINSYAEELNKIENKAFLTLSRVNVPEDELNAEISLILKEFGQIINSLEGKGRNKKIKGIRKVEVTYNVNTNEFHPHIHGIFSFEDAERIKKAWMRRCNELNIKVSHKGQDIRMADENSVIEVFKYCTKLFKINKEEKDQFGRQIINVDVKPLDVIFQALRKRRTFSAYGLKKKKIDKKEEKEVYDFLDFKIETWVWDASASNYTNAINETLTNDNFSKVYNIQIR
jgi:hypothetical protein